MYDFNCHFGCKVVRSSPLKKVPFHAVSFEFALSENLSDRIAHNKYINEVQVAKLV